MPVYCVLLPDRCIEGTGNCVIPDEEPVSCKDCRDRDRPGPVRLLVYREELPVIEIVPDIEEVDLQFRVVCGILLDKRQRPHAVAAVRVVEHDDNGSCLRETVIGRHRRSRILLSGRREGLFLPRHLLACRRERESKKEDDGKEERYSSFPLTFSFPRHVSVILPSRSLGSGEFISYRSVSPVLI